MSQTRFRSLSRGALLALLALCSLISPSPATANHSVTELVSTGPQANAPYDVCPTTTIWFATPCVLTSRDGRHVFFRTDDPLVSADHDGSADIYERFNGTTTLISTGPADANSEIDAFLRVVSPDGGRVIFETRDKLVGSDWDSPCVSWCSDVYERFDGTTTLLSTGPAETPGAPTSGDTNFLGASEDATHVFFEAWLRLTADDMDGGCAGGDGPCRDIYESFGGTTRLVSTGPADPQGPHGPIWGGTNRDGTHAFFLSYEPLVTEDTDCCEDLYDRSGGTTTLAAGPSADGVTYVASSDDASHLFFMTDKPLAAGDTDGFQPDIYERTGGTTSLVSTGPSDTQAWPVVCPQCVRVSADGSKVFFFTHEVLTPGDTGYLDLYERSGGTTKLVSTGPNGGDGPVHVSTTLAISRDGNHVFFQTAESLVAADMDTATDIYERSGGTTRLVSTGPSDTNTNTGAVLGGVSEDGLRAFFTTAARLVPSDTDSQSDLYERFAGTTTLISTGPNDSGTADGSYVGQTPDGSQVFFQSRAPMLSTDSDFCSAQSSGCADIYAARIGYPTPASASPLSVSLVPAFRQCAIGSNPANGRHAAPLSVNACLPPKPGSAVALFGAHATGTGGLSALPGNPDTTSDEADVSIDANLTDVQAATGGDYNPNPSGPDLTLTARLRITDLVQCAGAGCSGPYGRNPGTTADLDFPVAIDCASTADPSTGATCAATTSADAVMPGAIKESQQTSAQAFRLRLNDSGANGIRGDSDDRIFATQGIYIP